jgi:AbiU2
MLSYWVGLRLHGKKLEQVERNYIEVMGPELGAFYSCLWAECVHLHMTWGEYVILFGTSEDTVDLLNRAAPDFTRMVQDALWENVLMHLCRLVDSRTTLGKENLTIHRLPELVAPSLRPEVEQAILAAQSHFAFAKDWRNRRISHADLGLSLGGSSRPLALASRAKVKEALQALCRVLNLVEQHYTGTTIMYDFIEPHRGSRALLHVIKSGVKMEAERRERMLRGCPSPQDFE